MPRQLPQPQPRLQLSRISAGFLLPRVLPAPLPVLLSHLSATPPHSRLSTPEPSSSTRLPRLARPLLRKPLASSTTARIRKPLTRRLCSLLQARACSTTVAPQPALLCRPETASACAAAVRLAVQPLRESAQKHTSPHTCFPHCGFLRFVLG